MDWVTILRLFNAVGCAVALLYLSTAAYRQWSTWSKKTQQHWWALVGWVFLGLESALENAILGTPTGPRVFIHSIVIVFTIVALARNGEIQAQAESPWKKKV